MKKSFNIAVLGDVRGHLTLAVAEFQAVFGGS